MAVALAAPGVVGVDWIESVTISSFSSVLGEDQKRRIGDLFRKSRFIAENGVRAGFGLWEREGFACARTGAGWVFMSREQLSRQEYVGLYVSSSPGGEVKLSLSHGERFLPVLKIFLRFLQDTP